MKSHEQKRILRDNATAVFELDNTRHRKSVQFQKRLSLVLGLSLLILTLTLSIMVVL